MVVLHFAPPVVRWIGWPWNLVGLAPIAAGGVLAVVADAQFKRHRTTVKPFERSSALVTSGVFRYSRNPMYLGMLVTMVGVGIGLGTLMPLVVVPLLAVVLRNRFILAEEAMLEDAFGDDFRQYKTRTRRWL